jgi:hypothetical protein
VGLTIPAGVWAKVALNVGLGVYLIVESIVSRIAGLKAAVGTTPILELSATRQSLTCSRCKGYIWYPSFATLGVIVPVP